MNTQHSTLNTGNENKVEEFWMVINNMLFVLVVVLEEGKFDALFLFWDPQPQMIISH